MSNAPDELPQLPLTISNAAVIGLTDPQVGSWSRLRALQYGEFATIPISRIASHCVGAALVAFLVYNQISIFALLAWLVALVVAIGNMLRANSALQANLHRGMSKRQFWNHAASVAVLASVWSLALLFFAKDGSVELQTILWSIAAMLIAGSTTSFVMVPMVAMVFGAVTGLAAVIGFMLVGTPELAAIVIAFIVVCALGSIRNARTFLSARIAEAGVVEKSEVVSLLLREFEENEADWLWQVDVNRLVRSVSPRFAFALGKGAADVEGKPFIELISGEMWDAGNFPPSLHDLAETMKQRNSFSNMLVEVHLESGRRWWELSGTPILDERGAFAGYRGVGSDVTEQRESSEKIAYLARYDTLTGLPNRLMLNEALGDALRYAEQWRTRCAFLMIDLDRFKAVNDSLGHQVGDRLLEQVAARLKTLVTDNELCGRLGGDEFAIVIRDASDRKRVDQVANAVIQELSNPYEVDHHTLYVGASVGSAIGPRDGATVEPLMRNADLALYRAKDDGRGVHQRFEPSLYAHAEERRQLELSLRQALDRNEFSLNFQPVVDANREHLVSFEALLRWNSADHGPVSPAKFIPLAEDTRLIVPIGEWVLREACRQAMFWPDRIRVGVNVSVEQLLNPAFCDTIVRALAQTGLPAHRLEIEVTESIFLRDATTAKNTLQGIKDLGCGVALDDFGTGYSSLGYLRDVQFTTIKIDRSFVQGASNANAESIAIIRAVVAMAESLEMTTTAEGVENAEEVKMIRDLGCNKIQGFYFGRPMLADDARALFSQVRRDYG